MGRVFWLWLCALMYAAWCIIFGNQLIQRWSTLDYMGAAAFFFASLWAFRLALDTALEAIECHTEILKARLDALARRHRA